MVKGALIHAVSLFSLSPLSLSPPPPCMCVLGVGVDSPFEELLSWLSPKTDSWHIHYICTTVHIYCFFSHQLVMEWWLMNCLVQASSSIIGFPIAILGNGIFLVCCEILCVIFMFGQSL